VGFALCTRFIPDHRVRGVFIQTFFRSNIGVVGVSMAESMMGDFGVASMAMAIARDNDHELTGQVVVTTSFFCCLTLFLWIFCLGQVGLI